MKPIFFLALLMLLTACTQRVPVQEQSTNQPSNTVEMAGQPEAAPVKPAELQSPHPLSVIAFAQREFTGSNLVIGPILETTNAYTRHYITYQSEGLKISGIINIPHSDGPFPVLILNHGHIDTSIYTNGRGLKREQDYLARKGYVVLHTDYRNHADSDKVDPDELRFRLGYTEDAINAVNAVRASHDPRFDKDNIGMLGHSMGGGVTQNVMTMKPGFINAFVLYAPVSSDYSDNFRRWTRSRTEIADRIVREFGTASSSPEFWRNLSPINFFDRVTEPVQIYHGTADDSVPIEWSHRTRDTLQAAGKDVELIVYDNAPHEFINNFPAFMRGVTAFFDQHLK